MLDRRKLIKMVCKREFCVKEGEKEMKNERKRKDEQRKKECLLQVKSIPNFYENKETIQLKITESINQPIMCTSEWMG